MAKIIVAFNDRERREQITALLESAGLSVLRACSTGAEVMRTFSSCQDGILVCGFRFPDRTLNDICEDLGDRALILAVGKPEVLANCENQGIFKLPSPVNRGALIGAVNMLVQLHYMKRPKRNADEKQLINEAKLRLMESYGITEAEAHQMLQKMSMRSGIRMTESAKSILASEN